jgi:hypothetical protein
MTFEINDHVMYNHLFSDDPFIHRLSGRIMEHLPYPNHVRVYIIKRDRDMVSNLGMYELDVVEEGNIKGKIDMTLWQER